MVDLTKSENNGRFSGDASSVRPLGRIIKTVDNLTPEQKKQNEKWKREWEEEQRRKD